MVSYILSIKEAVLKKKEYYKRWTKLEDAISKASKKAGHYTQRTVKGKPTRLPVTIERRRLKALFEDDQYDTPVSIAELIALDRILSPPDSLTENPLLVRVGENFLHSYRNQQTMCVMIGARYLKERMTDMIATWDFRAFRKLYTAPELSHLRIDMFHAYCMPNKLDRVKDESWVKELDKEISITAIASPYVCHATEYLMAKILNLGNNKLPRLPCYLAWPKKKREQRLIYEDLNLKRDELRSKRIKNWTSVTDETRAFLVGRKLYLSTQIGTSYGLILAQRQPDNGKIFLVVCGAYGPTTHAACCYLAKGSLPAVLPPFDPDLAVQPVLTAVIGIEVEYRDKDRRNTDELRDNRKWIDSDVSPDVLLWTLEGDEWKSKAIKEN